MKRRYIAIFVIFATFLFLLFHNRSFFFTRGENTPEIKKIAGLLVNDLIFAKTSALSLSKNIIIKSNNENDWSKGWQIYIQYDNTDKNRFHSIIKSATMASDAVYIYASSDNVEFDSDGHSAGYSVFFQINSPNTVPSIIHISSQGLLSFSFDHSDM